MIVNRRELPAVMASLQAAIANNDQAALARWAAKHGPVMGSQLQHLYTVVPEGSVPEGGAARDARKDQSISAPPTSLPGRFIASLKDTGKEAAFRLAVEEFVGGGHKALVRLVTRWLGAELDLDKRMVAKLARAFSTPKGQVALAYALALAFTPFSKDKDGNETALASVVRELQVHGNTVAMRAGIAKGRELLTDYGPMVFQALQSVTSAEDFSKLATDVTTKLRVVADELPDPKAAEGEDEERGAKQTLRRARGGRG